MKKLLLVTAFLALFSFIACAQEVNAVLNDGTAIAGDLVGKTAESVIILSGGKAKEIQISKLKYVFDKKTGEQIDIGKPLATTSQEKTAEKSGQNSAEKKPAPAKSYASGNRARPAQEKPVAVESGSITEKVDYFKRENDRYIIIDWNIMSARFYTGYASALSAYDVYGERDTADNCPTCDDVAGLFDGAIGSGFGLLIRPFDFFAFGGYLDWEYSFPPYSVGKRAAVLDFPAGSYGASIRFIPFSMEDTADYEFYFYIQANIGKRNLNNLFDQAAKYETGAWKHLSGSGPETAIILGIGGIGDLKVGYIMSRITSITDEEGNAVKTPSGEDLTVDFSGMFVSMGLSINF